MTHPYSEPLAALFGHLIPEMVLLVCACILFVGGLFRAERKLWGGVALGGLLLAFLTLFLGPTSQNLANNAVFGVPFLFDSLSTWTRGLALATGVVFLLLCWDESPKRQVADHHACLLLIIAGVCLVGSANDLVALFLALELISIPTYVLLYLPKHDDASQEASLKYFLLSIFSSALLLFGFSYYFGLTGTTNIAGSLQVLYGATSDESKAVSGLAQVAMLMIAAGLGFRITAVPFHFYAPDVFQGASTSGAAQLSYIPKIAGFVAILRVFGFVVPAGVEMNHGAVGMALSEQVPTLFWFLAALTMTVGNILAILQDNLKRLLAYSSVAHAGYMLIGIASAPYLAGSDAPTSGVAAVLFYLVAYGAMTFGFFALILMLNRPERPVETVDDLAGLAKTQPVLALLVTVLMLSFLGFPFTAGFTGKFFVFFGALAVQAPSGVNWLYPLLALLGVLNAAVGAWYYLRIITVMYLRSAVKPVETPRASPGLFALIGCVVLTLGLAIPPGANWMLGAVRQTTVRAVPAPQQALIQDRP
jgi:NADH-quinone oxidoreductase subunit N